MSCLNAQIPTLRCFVRLQFLHNQDWAYRGQHAEVDVIGIKSEPGRVLGFHVLLRNGVVYWNVPIHGLCTKVDAQEVFWGRVQAWDNFSTHLAVTCFDRLAGLRAIIRPLGRKPERAIYHCTLDWYPDPESIDTTVTRLPAEAKTLHLLLAEDGNLYLMPNNMLQWKDPAFTVEPFPSKPTYRRNVHSWSVEQSGPVTADDSREFIFGNKEQAAGGKETVE